MSWAGQAGRVLARVGVAGGLASGLALKLQEQQQQQVGSVAGGVAGVSSRPALVRLGLQAKQRPEEANLHTTDPPSSKWDSNWDKR